MQMEQNSPVETFQVDKRGQPFQTNRLFRKSSGWAVEICLFHLLSVWNHRNFHVNGKQPRPIVAFFCSWLGLILYVEINIF